MEILVIDDDEIFCRLLVEIIEDWGAGTNWTTNGLVGYEMISKHAYDLCIIDVRMPLILGTELADAMREDFPEIKVILIRSEEHTSELQSHVNLVCRLLLEKKNNN